MNTTVQNGFLMSQEPAITNRSTIVGAVFLSQSQGKIVSENSRATDLNSNISAGAVYGLQSFSVVDFLRVVVIDSAIEYRNVTDPLNRRLGSSVVVASIQANTTQSYSNVNISLYFRARNDLLLDQINNADYFCSYYDSRTKYWNDSGCSKPLFNTVWNRYECYCNHLTSFALIWLPKTSDSGILNAQDIASLVFQSVSIVCFLIIISYTVYSQAISQKMDFKAKTLLPLASNAVTMILFAFYIALTLTVFTSTNSKNSDTCSLTASILMFFVYFFLIFMFCIKTSMAYFGYNQFVLLFPPPSFWQLYKLMMLSFSIAITYVAFAAGFNSDPSYKITQVYVMKICWFTRNVIHYFVTIPICVCLFLNIFMLLCVIRRMIQHLRYSTSPHGSYDDIKRCVLVIIASCITQGIGWLFGPALSFVDEKSANILGWFFVVFNGLEGLWTMLLFYFLEKIRRREQKRKFAVTDFVKQKTSKSRKRRYKTKDDNEFIRAANYISTEL